MRFLFRSVLVAVFVCLLTISYTGFSMASSDSFILDLYLGEPVPEEVMLDDVSSVRIIYVGEVHTIARHHEFQARILRELSNRNINLALGMEMFTADQQPILDLWQAGKEDVSALIRELGRDQWTNLKDYEAVLTTARESNIPILGLNATDKLVKKVAREGLASLSEEQKKHIPEHVEKMNPLHDRLLRLRLKVHKAFQEKALDSIVEAQSLRDETMAWTLSRYLETPAGKGRTLVVIAGTGHMNYSFGIPERAHRRNRLPFRIILPTESGELTLSEEEKRQSVPVNITHEDLRFLQVPIADYLHVVPLREAKEATTEAASSKDAEVSVR
jgi:uncharacterized iron-regulated protein